MAKDSLKKTKECISNDQTYGILGNLIIVLKEMHLLKNQTELFDLLANKQISFNSSAISRAVHNDFYSNAASLFLASQLEDAKGFKNRLFAKLTGIKDQNEKTYTIKMFTSRMKDIINATEYYASKKPDGIGNDTPFNPDDKEKLFNHFSASLSTFPLVHYIYILIYWSVLKALPSTFSFETHYQIELTEFNSKVICKYGLGSVAGRRAVMQLASTENIFALYELGNMYYYGNVENHQKNYTKALMYYRKAAGLSIDERINDAKCNPLALWIVAYMYINYQEGVELKNVTERVHEIERLQPNDRIDFAIRYCKHAVQLNNCVPALNLLGLISNRLEEADRNAFSLLAPEEYYAKAAEEGYVYAYNNLSKIEAKYIVSSSGIEQEKHVDNYIEYLAASAAEREPWACKKLGLFYYDGIISYEKEIREFKRRIDHQKSREYFEMAISLYSSENIAWSYAYLMIYFPEKYSSNTLLLEEHLEHCNDLQNKEAMEFLCENIHKTCIANISYNAQINFMKALKALEIKQELLDTVGEMFSLGKIKKC